MKKRVNQIIAALFGLLQIILPFGQLFRFQLTPTIAIYAFDLVVGILGVIWVTQKVYSKKHFVSPRFSAWPVSFVCVGLFSWLLNYARFGDMSWYGMLHLVRWVLYASLFWITYDIYKQHLYVFHMKSILLIQFVGLSIIGLLQYIWIPDTRFLFLWGWDDHLHRMIGTILDPGFLGILLVLGWIITIFESPMRQVTAGKRHLAEAILLVSLALTYARAAYLVWLLVLLALSWKRRTWIWALQRVVIFMVLVLCLPRLAGEGVKLERVQSIEARYNSSVAASTLIQEKWLLGAGYNNYRAAMGLSQASKVPSHTTAADNSYVHLAVTTGIIGLAIYLWYSSKIFRWAYDHSEILWSWMLAIGLHAFTNNTLFYPFVMIWFWMLLGSVMAKYKPSYSL